jgi:hypothetical protein
MFVLLVPVDSVEQIVIWQFVMVNFRTIRPCVMDMVLVLHPMFVLRALADTLVRIVRPQCATVYLRMQQMCAHLMEHVSD